MNGIWVPILLIGLGVWLVAQSLVGDLGGRILSYGGIK